jgi:7-keto-8-aminopelargonate synthetase-like enzyme
MGIYQKCASFTKVDEVKEKGIYPYFHHLESRQDVEVIMEGKRRIMLGSNNYLGLTTHPEVMKAAIKAMMVITTIISTRVNPFFMMFIANFYFSVSILKYTKEIT